MPFEKWQFAFTNGMSFDEQKKTYLQIAIPESKRTIRGGLTSVAHVDFEKDHPPLLFLAGTQDQSIPAHLCRRVFERYTSKKSITEFKLQDRNHYILGLPTWREDAGYILRWIQER
jgi:fermentation-respiration switch protein FrsA (DUF1100 family)